MTHCMREDRGTVDVPDRDGPPVEQLERGQLSRPLAPADAARVVFRPAPPRLVVVDVLVIGLVPILVALMQEGEEQPVVLGVGVLGLLGQKSEPGPAQEIRQPGIDAAGRIDQDRRARLDAQRSLAAVDGDPLVELRQEPLRHQHVTRGPVQQPLPAEQITGTRFHAAHHNMSSRNTSGPSREVDTWCADRAPADSGGDLAALEVAEEFLPFGVGGHAVFVGGPHRAPSGQERQV
jgi:hypothetical protein